MQVRAETVIGWIDMNLPPLSWRLIAIKNMKLFVDHNIASTKIDPSTCFNEEILAALKAQVKLDYNKELPSFN
jgi:hypothetical protein